MTYTKKQLTITVITPSYNQGSYIEKTIQSVLAQKGNFFLDYIIADGGSKDHTLEIVGKIKNTFRRSQRIKKGYNISFRFWTREDRGQSDAINKGIRVSKGDVFSWINSDDVYYGTHALDKVIRIFNQYPEVDVVVGDSLYIDEKNKPLGKFLTGLTREGKFQPDIHHLSFPQPSVFIRRGLHGDYMLDEHLYYMMDWDLWVRLLKNNHVFYYLPSVLSKFRIHSNSKSSNLNVSYYTERLKIHIKNHIWDRTFVYMCIMYGNVLLENTPVIGKGWRIFFQKFVHLSMKDFSRLVFRKNYFPIS